MRKDMIRRAKVPLILLMCLAVLGGASWFAFHPIKSSDGKLLSRWLSRWEFWAVFFAVVTFLGTTALSIADLEWRWLLSLPKKWERILTILLIVASLGSLTSFIRTNRLSDSIISLLGEKAQGALQKANHAIGTATKAEGQVRAQGPRAKLIAAIAPELAKKLAKFRGQKVELAVCGTQRSVSQETLDVWGIIATILGPDTTHGIVGAKWRLVPTNLTFSQQCSIRESGLGVAVSKFAPRKTIEAATALGDGLASALPPSPYPAVGFIRPGSVKMFVNHGFPVADLQPWETVAYKQDLIVVTIGAHPSK